MKLIIPMICVTIIGMVVAQSLSLASKAKTGVDAIYGENGIYDCGFKIVEANKMPVSTPKEIKAKNDFLEGCQR